MVQANGTRDLHLHWCVTTNYIKIRYMNLHVLMSRRVVCELFQKYINGVMLEPWATDTELVHMCK